MGSEDVDQKTNIFAGRKETIISEIALSGREDSRTYKYAANPHVDGQKLTDR